MASLQQQLPWEASRTVWAQQLNPVIANPIVQGVAITSVTLDANTPKTFSTTLNRMQQGWFLTDIMSAAKVWRTEAFNTTTITLEADADTTISIWVY